MSFLEFFGTPTLAMAAATAPAKGEGAGIVIGLDDPDTPEPRTFRGARPGHGVARRVAPDESETEALSPARAMRIAKHGEEAVEVVRRGDEGFSR